MGLITEESTALLKTILGNNQTLKYILDSLNQSIAVVDRNLVFIYFTKAAKKYASKIKVECFKYGGNLWDFVPQKKTAAAKRILKRIINGEQVTINCRHERVDGGDYWFEYTFLPVVDNAGEIEHIIIFGFDITQLKASEQIIKESEAKFKSIVQSQSGMICKFNLDGTITFVNNAYCNYFGTTEKKMIGSNFYHLIPESRSSKVKADIMLLSPANSTQSYTEMVIDNKKHKRWIRGTTMAFFDNDGNITEIQAIAEDITKEKEIQDELFKAKEKAEESERIKTVFLTNITHEIRTPLNGILGFSSLLKSSSTTKEKMIEYIDIIQQSSEQLLGIIDDILEISLIEKNQLSLHNSDVYLPNIFNNLLDYANNKLNECTNKNIQIKKCISTDAPNLIEIDGMKLYQVFMKLINNAVKFTHSGQVEFGYSLLGFDTIRFFVNDTGIGIPKEKHDIIFETFRQADESLSRKYAGTGLGLAIAKALVENMGSELQLKSQPHDGSCFYFDIKIPEPVMKKELQHTDQSNKSEYKWEGRKILIVEDVYSNFVLLREFIKNTSATILSAYTGTAALKNFKENPDLDLVLLDIRLPDINGFEVARKMKSINQCISIVAQTSYSFDLDQLEAYKAGCEAFLVKPITKELLLKTINDCLVKKAKYSVG